VDIVHGIYEFIAIFSHGGCFGSCLGLLILSMEGVT
jgi:hypothetical protein